MKNYSSIEGNVPKPWRTIGRVCILIGISSFFGYFWRLVFFPEPASDEMVLIAWVNFISFPIFACFLLPVFLDHYPAWLVRLVGRKYLTKLIDDCKKYLGENRVKKAHILLPHEWFNDQRYFWIAMIVSCGLLGCVVALGWL